MNTNTDRVMKHQSPPNRRLRSDQDLRLHLCPRRVNSCLLVFISSFHLNRNGFIPRPQYSVLLAE